MSSSGHNGRLFVFAAPSGAGKTTLVHAVVKKHPKELRFSISYTTREPRRNEANAVDYLFVSEDEFMRLRDNGEMLEHAHVFDNYYATSRSQVESHLADNRNVVLEIDWQGAQQVRESMPDCVTVFIMPPSLAELERRLRDRRTDSTAVIDRRLRDARSDMAHWEEFDYVIINDDLDKAVIDLEAVLSGEGETSSTDNVALQQAVSRIVG
jgi:guanylate kinase